MRHPSRICTPYRLSAPSTRESCRLYLQLVVCWLTLRTFSLSFWMNSFFFFLIFFLCFFLHYAFYDSLLRLLILRNLFLPSLILFIIIKIINLSPFNPLHILFREKFCHSHPIVLVHGSHTPPRLHCHLQAFAASFEGGEGGKVKGKEVV